MNLFDDSIIFITGGTGSWGNELVLQLLEKYPKIKQIRVYSRNEHKQVEMKYRFINNPKLKYIIGDVRDKNILTYAMKGVDIVFHLAALKHVPVCEDNSWETVLTNIYGTQNIIEAAMINNVKKVIDVSTDKAVDPFNIYGVSKACGEKLMINANTNYDSDTKFICIRGGNVIGTAGSVIPLFKKQIEENNEITITNESMTRFFMKKSEAIGLLFQAVEKSYGGEIFVMNMSAINVGDMAEIIIDMFGNKSTKKIVIGNRSGEKMYEVLVSKNEIPFTKILNENYYVILPQVLNYELKKIYSKFPFFKIDEFNSNNAKYMNNNDFKKLLINFFNENMNYRS